MNGQRHNLPVLVGTEMPMPSPAPQSDDDLASPGISMAQITCMVRANLKRSLIGLGVLVALSCLGIKLLPHSYVAEATLIVNHGDRNPLAEPAIAAGGWDVTFIPTQIELIQSPAVLQPVIDQLHLMSSKEWVSGFKGQPPAAQREGVFQELSKALNVYQGVGSDLLYIDASAKNPVEAAEIANAVADQYLQLNQQRINQPAAQNAALYSKELEQLREQTIQAQEQVTAFRQSHGMINLEPGNNDEAETALTDLEAKLLAAENQERNVQAQLGSQAWGIPAGQGAGGGDLAGNLSTEETELAKLRQTLGPKHPQVLELESQIAATKRTLASGLSSQLADAQKLVTQYTAAVATQRQLVLSQRRVQDQGTKMLLELESAEATYKRALDGYSQIQFASSGASNDVSLVSRAVPPVKALKPNKPKLLLMALVLSIGMAFGIPFVYELFLNRRLRCRDDLERNFGIPVLAQFEPIERAG